MKLKGNKNTTLLVLSVIIIALVVGIYLIQQKTAYKPDAAYPEYSQNQSQPAINDIGDLNKALDNLDNTNINELNQWINQNEVDSSGF